MPRRARSLFPAMLALAAAGCGTPASPDGGDDDVRAAAAHPHNADGLAPLRFDPSHCAPPLAPGEMLVVQVEAVSNGSAGEPASGASFAPAVTAQVRVRVGGASDGVLYDPNPTTNADD